MASSHRAEGITAIPSSPTGSLPSTDKSGRTRKFSRQVENFVLIDQLGINNGPYDTRIPRAASNRRNRDHGQRRN